MTKYWQKFLLKTDLKTRNILELILKDLLSGNFGNLDIKPLVGRQGFFRCRSGKIRVIFSIKGKDIIIEDIGYRGDVYK